MITPHLFELLYEHNCVVLPGFGGFIANRLPSKVNEGQQRVEPPRKVVAFNSNLNQNDGLLANQIAGKENISFDEAVLKINAFVDQIRSEIQLKKHASLNGIGEFYLNSEGKIVFVPEADINFSKETFGLFPISIRKIVREQEIQRVVEKETQRSQPLPYVKPRTTRSRKWMYSAVLIAVPIIVGFFTQQAGILQKADFNISGIFKNQLPAITSPAKSPEIRKEETKQEETKQMESIQSAPPIIKEESKTESETPLPPATTNITTYAKQEIVHSGSNLFHIIGGSFGIATNAQNFMKQLQSKGYNAYIAGTNAKGLTMVSYGNFSTEAEALQFLQKIQQTENVQAWLFNNDGR